MARTLICYCDEDRFCPVHGIPERDLIAQELPRYRCTGCGQHFKQLAVQKPGRLLCAGCAS